MNPTEASAEIEKVPFVPIRLHLVSGKTMDIPQAGIAWMMRTAVMVLQGIERDPNNRGRYDVVALRNIERIEQLTLVE